MGSGTWEALRKCVSSVLILEGRNVRLAEERPQPAAGYGPGPHGGGRTQLRARGRTGTWKRRRTGWAGSQSPGSGIT